MSKTKKRELKRAREEERSNPCLACQVRGKGCDASCVGNLPRELDPFTEAKAKRDFARRVGNHERFLGRVDEETRKRYWKFSVAWALSHEGN